jgi:hypothetical protein
LDIDFTTAFFLKISKSACETQKYSTRIGKFHVSRDFSGRHDNEIALAFAITIHLRDWLAERVKSDRSSTMAIAYTNTIEALDLR